MYVYLIKIIIYYLRHTQNTDLQGTFFRLQLQQNLK